MSILDRALRLGEGKQFKQYARRVERIGAWEPELELLEDDELREQFQELRRRHQEDGESLDELLPEAFAITQNNQPYEEKRAAYAADITYGTNSEFGFDYLRDNMATTLEEKVQHGGRIDEGDGGAR